MTDKIRGDVPALLGLHVVDVTRKVAPLDLDNLYRRYQSGESLAEIAGSIHIGATTLHRHLRHAGFGTPRSRNPGRSELESLYIDRQLSVIQIAPQFAVHPATVAQWLRRYGLTRPMSESVRIRNARMTREERFVNTSAAHDAVRGRTKSWEDLCLKALGRERLSSNVSPSDRWLAAQIPGSHLATAIGPYNADVTIGRLAVECFGGQWHGSGRAMARWPRRLRYLLDEGWSVLVVWIDQRRYPLGLGAANYAIALTQLASRLPATRGEYRVIRGDGQEIIRGCSDDDDFPVKPPRGACLPIRCEHDLATD